MHLQTHFRHEAPTKMRVGSSIDQTLIDRHAARNELHAATFGKRKPSIARLLLSPTGAMAIELKAED